MIIKRFLLVLMAAVALITFSGCKDDHEEMPPTVGEGTNYLVMYYAVGGGNLDDCLIANIAQAIDEGGNGNVKMTFQFKGSVSLQNCQPLANFDGTRRFTLDGNAHLKGKFKSVSKNYPSLDEKSFVYYADNLKTERFADADYDMSGPQGLTDFIRWSKELYPDAKRTILVLSDHGGGWTAMDDGMSRTRAILFDDNLGYASCSVQDIVDGVNGAGGVDMIYTDACLMSMYENIYGYAQCAKYLLTSVEVTPGEGGDYRKFISLLKQAGPSYADLEDAMGKFCDYSTSRNWWGMYRDNYADLGLYNLTKLDGLTPVLRKVSGTLTEKFSSNEFIQPSVADPELGDSSRAYISVAQANCQISYSDMDYNVSGIPVELLPYMVADNMTFIKSPFSESTYVDAKELINWIRYAPTDNAEKAYEAYPEAWEELTEMIISGTTYSFSLTDLLRQLDNGLTEAGAANNPFHQLRTDLLSALKSVAHISCTTPDQKPGIDQAYELCSPGIFLAPLNENYYLQRNPLAMFFEDHNQVLDIYRTTAFDRSVEWSRFLQTTAFLPSILFNPDRKRVK